MIEILGAIPLRYLCDTSALPLLGAIPLGYHPGAPRLDALPCTNVRAHTRTPVDAWGVNLPVNALRFNLGRPLSTRAIDALRTRQVHE